MKNAKDKKINFSVIKAELKQKNKIENIFLKIIFKNSFWKKLDKWISELIW